MKKSKITLAAVFSGIFGSVFGVICFFAFNFLWNGAIGKSIIYALAISLLLWSLVFVLKKIKSTRRNFQRNAIFEITVFAIYIIVAFISIFPYSHYFTVFNRKKIIKEKIVADVDNTINMFSEYEVYANSRIAKYESLLKTTIAGQDLNKTAFLSEGFQNNGEPINDQKDRLMKIFKDDLMPAQYDTTKQYATKFLINAKTTVTDWVIPIRFMNVINSIEKNAHDWLSELKGYDNRTKKAIGTPFDYTISFVSVQKELTERSTPSLLAIFTAIFLLFFLLFPYFFASRSPRHSGLLNELTKKRTDEDGLGTTL